ncbi:MAG: hypothetical protein ABEH40_04825 [Haloferacaceae archaeon]
MTEADGYWRFCEIIERTVVTSPTITSAPGTERVVLEQHTGSGAYRIRSLQDVTIEAADG